MLNKIQSKWPIRVIRMMIVVLCVQRQRIMQLVIVAHCAGDWYVINVCLYSKKKTLETVVCTQCVRMMGASSCTTFCINYPIRTSLCTSHDFIRLPSCPLCQRATDMVDILSGGLNKMIGNDCLCRRSITFFGVLALFISAGSADLFESLGP